MVSPCFLQFFFSSFSLTIVHLESGSLLHAPRKLCLTISLPVRKENIAWTVIGMLAWAWAIYWILVFLTGTTAIFKSVL
jgi:hypothetical protein